MSWWKVVVELIECPCRILWWLERHSTLQRRRGLSASTVRWDGQGETRTSDIKWSRFSLQDTRPPPLFSPSRSTTCWETPSACEKPKKKLMNKLKYIDAVLKETLRLQPTAPLIALESKEEQMTLSGGYLVHKADTLSVLLSLLHRHPKVWKRAEEFLPERMLDGSFENLPPNAWKTFFNGQRACIGHPFSWQKSLLAIVLILKHFNVELFDPSPELSSSEPCSTGSTPAWPHSTQPSERWQWIDQWFWSLPCTRAMRVRCWAAGLGENLSEDSELHLTKPVE